LIAFGQRRCAEVLVNSALCVFLEGPAMSRKLTDSRVHPVPTNATMRFRNLIPVLVLLAAMPAAAQTVETPVAFDSAGRILSVSKSLVTRLDLAAPSWPVSGEFIEARLYSVSSGGYVMTVTRPAGTLERYPLTDAQFAGLRDAVHAALAREGKVVAEDAATVISEPARGPFVRDQMLLASIIYGPSIATLMGDDAAGSGAYLLTVGGTFFAVNQFARTRMISKAQNALTTDGALRGWAATALAVSATGTRMDGDGAALTALLGGIGGSVIGYTRGKRLTHAEAQSAMTGSTLLAGATIGLGYATGVVGEDSDQGASTAVLAGGIAGYLLGPRYPRQAPYTVTAGDVSMVRLGAILGSAAAISPTVDADIDPRLGVGIATAGWVAGALIADRVAAKPFNHSTSEARLVYLGALGGGLMGIAFPVMVRAESGTPYMIGFSAGALVGTAVTQNMLKPSREGSALMSPTGNGNRGAKFEFSPEGLALALAGQRGLHPVLSVRF
jgi:hypothetical protein